MTQPMGLGSWRRRMVASVVAISLLAGMLPLGMSGRLPLSWLPGSITGLVSRTVRGLLDDGPPKPKMADPRQAEAARPDGYVDPTAGSEVKPPSIGVVDPNAPKGFVPGRSVEVPGARTPTQKVFANPDGSKTAKVFAGPVHFRKANEMREIDTSLQPAADGLAAAAVEHPVHIRGGADPGVRLGEPGRSIDLGWSGQAGTDAAKPKVDGRSRSTATVRDVAPGVDLTFRVLPNGVNETIDVESREALAALGTIELPLELDGLTPQTQSDGTILFLDATGTGYALRQGRVWDSNVDEHLGESPSGPVRFAVVSTPEGSRLRVTPDAEYIADPARQFPVHIDPEPVSFPQHPGGADDVTVTSAWPDATWNGEQQPWSQTTGLFDNKVGYYDESTGWNEAWNWFDLTALAGKTVTSAIWNGYWDWSYDPTNPTQYVMYPNNPSWCGCNVTWNNKPSRIANEWRVGHALRGTESTTDLTAWVQKWVSGTWPNYGVSIDTGGLGYEAWKRLAAYENGNNLGPMLEVTYLDYDAGYYPWGVTTDPNGAPGTVWTGPTPTASSTLPLRIYNFGEDTWTAGQYYLGYHVKNRDGSVVTWDNPGATWIPRDIPQNDFFDVSLSIAPLPAGAYRIEVEMAHAGWAWFQHRGVAPLGIDILVKDPATPMKPADNEVVVDAVDRSKLDVELTALQQPGVSQYRFEVSTSPSFASIAATSGWIGAGSLGQVPWRVTPGLLKDGSKYHWRMAGRDATAQSAYSPTRSFTLDVRQLGQRPNNPVYDLEINGPVSAQVDLSSGNLVANVPLVNLPTSSQPVSVSAAYNSQASNLDGYVDDRLPAGAVLPLGAEPTFTTGRKVSGSSSIYVPSAVGLHQQYFYGSVEKTIVPAGAWLETSVWLDPSVREVMLQFSSDQEGFNHRAYWGEDLIPWGAPGSYQRFRAGALPTTGRWVRLVLKASDLGLEGKSVSGMAFTLYNGQGWFDAAGIVKPGLGRGWSLGNKLELADLSLTSLRMIDPAGGTVYAGGDLTKVDTVEVADTSGGTVSFRKTSAAGPSMTFAPPAGRRDLLARAADGSFQLSTGDGLTYQFNSDGALMTVTVDEAGPGQPALRYEYTANNGPLRLDKIRDAESRQVVFFWDTTPGPRFGRLVTVMGWDENPGTGLNRQLSLTYDDSGQLWSVTGPGGHLTAFLSTNGDYSTTVWGGLLSGIMMPQALDAATPPNTLWGTYDITYGGTGVAGDRVTKVVAPPDSLNQRPTTTFTYQYGDTLVKEPRCVANAAFCPSGWSTRSAFDTRHRETSDMDATGATRRYGYDVNNRRISVVDAAGRVQETTLDGDGKALASRGNQPSFKYPAGWGLYGEYFSTPDLSGEPVTAQLNGTIDFNYGTGAPSGTTLPVDGFSARWSGYLTVPSPGGYYTLTTSADDGTRVLVDGNVVIDNWVSQGETAISGGISLTPGEHRIIVEYSEMGGPGAVHLRWSGPGVTTGTIPQSALTPALFVSTRVLYDQDPAGQPMTGLRAQFWDNKDMAGLPKAQQTYHFSSGILDTTWNDGSPAPGIGGDNWSARFTGKLAVTTAGNYRFTAGADDGVRVFIDGQLVADSWRQGLYAEVTSNQMALTRGDHTIQIDYMEVYGAARVRLAWSLNGGSVTNVPVSATRPAYGLVTTSVDEDGDRTTFRYDGGGIQTIDPIRGLVTDETETGAVDGIDRPLTKHRSYDALGRVSGSITPRGMLQPAGLARDPYTTRYWHLARNEVPPPGFPAPAPPATHPRMVDVTLPSGQHTRTEQDESGGVIAETTWGTGLPAAGLKTTYAYDAAGNQTQITGPAVTNVVTGVTTQTRLATTYEPNGATRTATMTDVPSGQSRTTTLVHDRLGREVKLKDVFGFEINRTFDLDGNLTDVVDQRGSQQRTTYDTRGLPTQVQVVNYLDPATNTTAPAVTLSTTHYAADGQPDWTDDALGRRTTIEYDAAGRPWRSTLTNYKDDTSQPTSRSIVLNQATYTNAGQPLTEISGGGLRTVQHAYDKAGRRISTRMDPNGLNRTATVRYDANDNPIRTQISLGDPALAGTAVDETISAYDPADRLTDSSVRFGNQAADLLTTHWDRDVFGNPTLIRDPAGRETRIEYDPLGRQVRLTEPATTVETSTTTPTTTSPVSSMGYDAFGNQTHEKDAAGNTTIIDYDAGNRRWRIRHPAYTPPGGITVNPVEVWQYDRAGNVANYTSRRNQLTLYGFDSLNRNTKTTDPLVSGKPAPGTVISSYDWQGNRVAVVDQNGARTEQTYDSLNRPRTATELVRNGTATPNRYTTTFGHNDAGDRTSITNPNGFTTTAFYDALGQQYQTRDAELKISKALFDHAGRTRGTVDPLGRATERRYDRAGRLMRATARKASTTSDPMAGVALSATAWAYDKVGNRTKEWTADDIVAGRDPDVSPTSLPTNEWAYNAAGALTSVLTRPDTTQTISTTYGYDANGNLTRHTNGEGHATWLTYQPWDLVEKVMEPSTSLHPSLADRTWTRTYDAGGLAVGETQPGGTGITRTYDELGRIRTEAGSGGGAPTGSKQWGWDLAGRQTMASHPAAPITFTWDDRGLLTSSTGGASTASFEYFPGGELKKRTDAAGTSSFTWTARGQLQTLTDPLTGTTQTRRYDDAGQLFKVEMPSGARRDLTWDDQGRLKTDTLVSSVGQVTAGHGYGYDNDGNVTSQDLTLPGNPSAGRHTYEYDRASRLTKWTTPAGTPTGYGWDRSGNRTSVGGAVSTYDARNRLVTGPEGTNTWSARGTLSSTASTGGTTSYTFDALGRMTQAATPGGTVSYTFDALDRIAARNGQPFTYAASELDPVKDGSFTYARGPAGEIAALSGPAGARLVGSDDHNDVTHLYGSTGTVTDTAAFDPFGEVAGETGATNPTVGFQGDFTDPTTNKVWMGARWYDPNTGSFLSRDDYDGELATPISLNRYTYAQGDPLGLWDPNGNVGMPKFVKAVGNAFKKAAVGVWHAAVDVWHGAVEVFHDVVDWGRNTWNDATERVGAAIDAAVDRGRDAVRTAGNAATSFTRAAVQEVTRTVTTFADKAAIAYRTAKTIPRAAVKVMQQVDEGARRALKAAVAEGQKAMRATADAAAAARKWAQENAATIAKTAAVAATGVLTYAACTGATVGGGAVACLVVAGAAAGALNGALNCPKGKSVAGCAGKGALTGAAAAGLATGIGTVLGGGMIATAVGGAAVSAAEQYMTTGQVSAKGVAMGAGVAVAFAGAGRVAGRAGGCNSFVPSTAVLMADGTSKQIGDVRVGDSVKAADPATGRSGDHRVTNVIVGTGLKDLVDVSVDGGATTTATAGHPYYRTDDQTWVGAGDLEVGDHVVDAGGLTRTVTSLREYRQEATVWNLTVEGLHTFYAGTEHILVHNTGGSCPIHGNVKSNPRPSHRYIIVDTDTSSTFKTGVSSQPLNGNGSSPRANTQVNKLNTSQAGRYEAIVVERDVVRSRAYVLGEEQAFVDAYYSAYRQMPPGMQRPLPTAVKAGRRR